MTRFNSDPNRRAGEGSESASGRTCFCTCQVRFAASLSVNHLVASGLQGGNAFGEILQGGENIEGFQSRESLQPQVLKSVFHLCQSVAKFFCEPPFAFKKLIV